MSDQTRALRIEQCLRNALDPQSMEIQDDSARHAGHAGMKGLDAAGETHFRIALTSTRFKGLSRVDRHRLVQDLLADEFDRGLHALSLVLNEPS